MKAVFWVVLGCGVSFAAQGGERVAVDGSTGVAPLVVALAKAYRERNPVIMIEIGKGLGTKARVQALAEGRIDIAMASHGLDAQELARQGLSVVEIAKVPVVFAVNSSVPVKTLTESQVCRIYARQLVNWSEVGGPGLPIAPRTRPDTEVDAEVVRARIGCLKTLQMSDAVRSMARSGDMAKELAFTAGAIGMTTMTVVEQSQARVRPLALNGVEPSADNVRSGAYALTRDSFLVSKAKPAIAVVQFLAFVRSAEGRQVIQANGAIPTD